MSTLVVTGMLGRVAVQALVDAGYEYVSPTDEFTLNTQGDYQLDLVEPYCEPRVQQITYGPPKKGKGGKVKRW